jgi:histidinol-phosphate aminotransferase
MGIEKLIRANLVDMCGYTPVEPLEILSKRTRLSAERIVKLDGNENPYGCSPKVNKALGEYPYFNIYPDPEQRELRSALEKYTGFSYRQIVCGSGSDDLIDLILRLFINPGDKVINCPPTFGMYPFSTSICGGEVINIDRDDDFNLDIPGIIKAIDHKTKVIFLASPNNPTGNCVSRQEIIELLATDKVVVLDEAYVDFSNETLADLVNKYQNILVLRTFSKWAGLAGLRIGYGLFPTEIVSYLMKIKQPYNASVAAQAGVLASLEDISYLRSNITKIVMERERLSSKLKELKWLNTYPSRANFILCSLKQDSNISIVGSSGFSKEPLARKIWYQLRKKGVFIRYYDTPRLKNFIRITVGRPEDTDRVMKALTEVVING